MMRLGIRILRFVGLFLFFACTSARQHHRSPQEASVSLPERPEDCLAVAQLELPLLLGQFRAATHKTLETQELSQFQPFILPGSPMERMLEWFLSTGSFSASAGGEIVVLGLPLLIAEGLPHLPTGRCGWRTEGSLLEIELVIEGVTKNEGPIKESPAIVLAYEEGSFWIYGLNKALFEEVRASFMRQMN
jgi:hypothetical protein